MLKTLSCAVVKALTRKEKGRIRLEATSALKAKVKVLKKTKYVSLLLSLILSPTVSCSHVPLLVFNTVFALADVTLTYRC